MSKASFAIVLSGCGVFDGSEIHESVCTMLAIEKAGCSYQCFAPNIEQAKVIDHITGDATALAGDEETFTRNVLVESARICRGNIKDLKDYDADEFDAIVFPGGFGAAVNLCSFAKDGAKCDVNKDVEKAILSTHEAGKVICALCIAPALIASVLGKQNITLTIGTDAKIAAGISQTGAIHENKNSGEVCVDDENLIVTTPCYMLDKSLKDVASSAEKAISEVLELLS